MPACCMMTVEGVTEIVADCEYSSSAFHASSASSSRRASARRGMSVRFCTNEHYNSVSCLQLV